jgi:hypothetical protein
MLLVLVTLAVPLGSTDADSGRVAANAKCDAKSIADGMMAAGARTLTSATASFTAADVGKTVWIEGAGPGGAALVTTVAGFTSASSVSTAAAAAASVVQATIYWGSDDAAALQAALNAARATGVGATVSVPRGVCLSTTSLNIFARTTLIGEGKTTSRLVFATAGDGIRSTWPINSSTAAWIRIAHLSLINTHSANTGAGFADVGGSFVTLDEIYIQRFAYGAIFDQTEVSEIKNSQFEQQPKAGVWLVNGADHTPGANPGYTNSIKILNNQFNSTSGVNILDDGYSNHLIAGNNFHGGTIGIRVGRTIGLTVLNNEFEGHTQAAIHFATKTAVLSAAVGPSFGFSIRNNTFSDIAPHHIYLESASAGEIVGNAFAQMTTSAIGIEYGSNPQISQIDIRNNSKLVTGPWKAAAPFINASPQALNANNLTQQAQTYVAAGILPGPNTVTPASMEGIKLGHRLMAINADGTNVEQTIVTSTSARTFAATFASAKAANWLIYGLNATESGIWTPTVVGAVTAGTQTYRVQQGNYVKSGNKVHIKGHLALSSKGGTTAGAVQITGLPFNPDPSSNTTSTVSIGFYDGWTFEPGYSQFAGVIDPSAVAIIGLRKMGSGRPGATVTAAEMGATATIIFEATYYTY